MIARKGRRGTEVDLSKQFNFVVVIIIIPRGTTSQCGGKILQSQVTQETEARESRVPG